MNDYTVGKKVEDGPLWFDGNCNICDRANTKDCPYFGDNIDYLPCDSIKVTNIFKIKRR